jgi:formate dehydrogenase major subunit
MSLERRDFLKLTAACATVTAFGGLGLDLTQVHAAAEMAKLKGSKQTTSVCCYCSVGCGLIVSTAQDGKGRAVNVEGDPDHPINEGSLCPKGASIWQLTENDKRITKVLYRAPNSDKWQTKTYDWALKEIAKRVKKVRDAAFQPKNAKGIEVNRLEAIASVGSAAMDNEECWIYQEMLRALGLTYIEHQARI